MTRGKGTWRPYRKPVDPDEDLAAHEAGQGLRQLAKWGDPADPAEPPQPNSYAKGILGEQDVAARLEPLTRTAWRVLNSVQVTEYGGDIDHVLVGPPGSYDQHQAPRRTAGGRRAADTIWIGRYPKDYADHAKEEAHTATNRLRFASGLHVTVLPVIVILVGPDGRLRIRAARPA